MKKRFLALALVLAMALSLMVVPVSATETEEGTTTYLLASSTTTSADGTITEEAYTYDANGNELTYTFSHDSWHTESITYTYDENGNMLTSTCTVVNYGVTYTYSFVYTYDKNGNVLTLTELTGTDVTTTFIWTYDESGNMLTENGSTNYGYTWAFTYTYDENGNELTETQTDSYGSNNVYTYTYDESGNRLTETYSSSDGYTHTYSWSYDENGNTLTETYTDSNGSSHTYTYTYSYDENGNELSYTYSDEDGYTYGWTKTYDENGNVLTYTSEDGSSTIYSYDENGNLQTEQGYVNGELSYTTTYSYIALTIDPEPTTSGQCGDNAYWSFDAATGTLTISGTGNMYNYEYETAPWYNYYPDITSVVIEDGITSIGNYAFMDCWMTSITLPDTLTSIGEEAFMFCTQLTGITLPDSLVSIGARAFEWCNFESIIIPGSVTSIGDGAFYMCDGLTEITIPSSVTSIGAEVFSWCESLEEIKFLGDAPVIGEDAFLHISEATAYYPAGNDTWTEDVRQQYGAYSITWVAYEVEPTDPEPTDDNPFTDVNTTHYFYDSVLWAVEQGITSGTTETTFSPFLTAERCQVVTFLWRAAGCPEVAEGTENPFTDVSEDNYFYTAVLWAVEQGITTGTSDTTFSPYTTCERCQVVTFLYRYAGEPEVTSSENPFTDVNEDNYFYSAVLWAVENSVTSGTTDTTFGPFVTCERCMVVTFLYRALVG